MSVINEWKKCPACKLGLPDTPEYFLESGGGVCRGCIVAYDRARLFNLGQDDYDAMLKEQNYCCAICSTPTKNLKRRLAVDHDHSCCQSIRNVCGKCIRGLLCNKCNLGLGYFDDDIKLLERAVQYLSKYVKKVT